ncbi:MAG: potassium transporter Kup [Acetobacteraceae bacterium]|nr:potassium transporter Kup [Acetobacteraceae bacterium]
MSKAQAATAGGSGRSDAKAQPRAAALVGVLGVVYGDIGTSPLYTLKASLLHFADDGLAAEEVLGTISLIIWALIMIVTVKYVMFVMRADNRGEGGILALMALASRGITSQRWRTVVMMLGVAGAALFFGDGVITPAISVLSAVEGLQVVEPKLHQAVVPISLVVLVGLFALQPRGTGRIGALFGPICALWFTSIALVGLLGIFRQPQILLALDPRRAALLIGAEHLESFVTLGSIVLAVTGAEALYADMGHFGREPIRQAWLFFVLPSLALNYLGQGALMLSDPTALENPFFLLCPELVRLPMVFLATAATVIASQSMIAGAYSVARQTALLNLLPRLTVRHTSVEEEGQVYMPQVNMVLLIGVVTLVLTFRNSDSLAAAYGIAVTGTFLCTSILGIVVARRRWRWPRSVALAVFGGFAVVDSFFFASNLLKFVDGGWVPVVLGAVMFLMMTTWRRGRDLLFERWQADSLPLAMWLSRLPQSRVLRVPGTAVFLTGNLDYVPGALLHNLKHNKVVHERVVFLTVTITDYSTVPAEERAEVEELSAGIHRVRLRYGFMESPNIPRALDECRSLGLALEPMQTSYFLGRETLVPAALPKLSRWRHWLFMLMARNAQSATEFFRIPADRVVELGVRVAI